MNEALCSVLCNYEHWQWNPYGSEWIQFKEDGTGELWYVYEHSFLIAVNFMWRSLMRAPYEEDDDDDGNNDINNNKNKNKNKPNTAVATTSEPRADSTSSIWTRAKPQLLGIAQLEITLTRTLADGWGAPSQRNDPHRLSFNHFNERQLSDAAVQPKTFHIRVEKGSFIPGAFRGWPGIKHEARYGLRLLFDRSPYPPRAEWLEPNWGPIPDCEIWDIVEFVAKQLPTWEIKGLPMNDPEPAPRYGKCVVT